MIKRNVKQVVQTDKKQNLLKLDSRRSVGTNIPEWVRRDTKRHEMRHEKSSNESAWFRA